MTYNKIHITILYICIITLFGFTLSLNNIRNSLYNDNQRYLNDLRSLLTPKDGAPNQIVDSQNSIPIEPYLIRQYCLTNSNNPNVNWEYTTGLNGTLIYSCKFKNPNEGFIADVLCRDILNSKQFIGRSKDDQKSCEFKSKL